MVTLAVGDSHGHHDRIEALLTQEGLLDGDTRLRPEVTLVHLGDVGHYGHGGSPTGDALTLDAVRRWFDVVLWGNHDRAVLESAHIFGGFQHPSREVVALLRGMRDDGKLRLAYAAHGFLLTHAGLHADFADQDIPAQLKADVVEFVEWLCDNDAKDRTVQDSRGGPEADWPPRDFFAIRDAIGHNRGGWSKSGGVLWRDASEPLYTGFRQVFGHTSGPVVRTYPSVLGDSYCIDVGDKDNGRLAGLWLPSETIVGVQL